jgi:hypothetical protein
MLQDRNLPLGPYRSTPYINSGSIGIVKSSQQSTITDGTTGIYLINLR